jgi:hypothetical protein
MALKIYFIFFRGVLPVSKKTSYTHFFEGGVFENFILQFFIILFFSDSFGLAEQRSSGARDP